ncbi:MAG: Ppx/GppA phosphatase family protein [Pseudomonadota bacterium]
MGNSQNDSVSTDGNRAETAADPASEGAGAPEKKGKRRRQRRRGRRNSAKNQAQKTTSVQTENPSVSDLNPAAPEADRQNKTPSNKRRRTRRPGRKVQQTQAAQNADLKQHAPNQARGRSKTQSRPQSRLRSRPPRKAPRADAYAALDLGTNNCRLLMAVPSAPDHFRVVGSFSRIVRLGDGLEHSGRLRDDAMDRAVEALKICNQRLTSARIRRARLIATEACRRANNGAEFLARVQKEAGLELEIVDRETEARLAVAGCGSLLDPRAQGAVLFDIGGGSTEIALLDLANGHADQPGKNICAWTSLPVGVVTLADRFGGKEVTREIYEAMVDWVTVMIEGFENREALAALHNSEHFHLLGTSGTVTTLAGIHLKLERYDRRRVDGTWMADGQMTAMVDELLGMDLAQRKASPCIGEDRADLVLAGCAILDAIRRQWPSRRLRVADRGLREGLLMEMMHEDSAWLGLKTHKRKPEAKR